MLRLLSKDYRLAFGSMNDAGGACIFEDALKVAFKKGAFTKTITGTEARIMLQNHEFKAVYILVTSFDDINMEDSLLFA